MMGTNALLEAVKAKKLEVARVLVEKGAKVNVKDDDENWAIHLAVVSAAYPIAGNRI